MGGAQSRWLKSARFQLPRSKVEYCVRTVGCVNVWGIMVKGEGGAGEGQMVGGN